MYKYIMRNGTQPTTIPSSFVVLVDFENENVVVQTSGVPNVDIEKIMSNIIGGDVYEFYKVRIEVISTLDNSTKSSIVTAPISYKIKTSTGDVINQPIYPLLSVAQQVQLADINLDGVLLNVDSSFKVSSLPPFTKVKYSFYPKSLETATGTIYRGDTDTELEIPDLNEIDIETNSENKTQESFSFASSNTQQEDEEMLLGNKKITNKRILLWILLGFGVGATIKWLKK